MSKTVLVVDDDAEFLADLTPLLKDAGYVVVEAKNGKEALTVLAQPDLRVHAAIVDLAMPEVGGFQVIGELGKVQRRQIPLIAITGAYERHYLEVAEYLGAQVSLRKPERGKSLASIVKALNELMAKSSPTEG